MNENNPNPADSVSVMRDALDYVKAMLDSGLIDASSLGLTTIGEQPSGAPALAALVPGTPITVRELVAKARVGLKESTHRTYGSYMKLLAEGHIDPLDSTLTHPGLGDRWAHEVLPSELEELLAFVKRRALVHAERRAASRQSVGRATRESDGAGACYNAVGAWRRVFEVAVKDRHLAKQFNPA
jgi:hypothetical protein